MWLQSLKYIEVCFTAQHTVYHGECFMWTLEECASWMEHSRNVSEVKLVVMFFKSSSCLFLFSFGLSHLSLIESVVLKTPTTIVELFLLLFYYKVFCSVYLVFSYLAYVYICYSFLINWPFVHYEMFLFVVIYIFLNFILFDITIVTPDVLLLLLCVISFPSFYL